MGHTNSCCRDEIVSAGVSNEDVWSCSACNNGPVSCSYSCMDAKPGRAMPSLSGDLIDGPDQNDVPVLGEPLRYSPVPFDPGLDEDFTCVNELPESSYPAVPFDPGLDNDWSQGSNITASGMQRPRDGLSVAFNGEEWLRGVATGRDIMLVSTYAESLGGICVRWKKVPATLYVNLALTKLTILPTRVVEFLEITIRVDRIQAICAATTSGKILDLDESVLNDSEKERAVLIQYISEDADNKDVCFCVESGNLKDRFIDALTILWHKKHEEFRPWL